MKINKMRSMLKALTEQKAPSAQIDLWPAIESRVLMSQSTQSRGNIMETQAQKQQIPQHQYRKPAFVLAAMLLVGALFLLIPQGRALAQEVFHFFNRNESNYMPGVTVTPEKWVDQIPGIAAATITPQPTPTVPASLGPVFEDDCGFFSEPRCSIQEIREKVAFPIFALPTLPDGMYFVGATGSPNQAHLFYTNPDHTGNIAIWEEPLLGDGSRQSWEVGADADIQQVQIGATTGEYVKGSYDGSSNPPVWNSNANVQVLRWVNQGVLINLQVLGTVPKLSRDDLVALAATLTNGPVGAEVSEASLTAAPTPTDIPFDPKTLYPLTLAQAEEKAGFKVLSPRSMPERMIFMGAKYDEETRIVEQSYHYSHPTNPEATDGLIIRQMPAPEGADCELCGFLQGNGKQVDQYPLGKLVSNDAVIETVQFSRFTGQYVEGIGWMSWTDATGWQWDSTPWIKRLRFQAFEMAFDITAFTFELTKADVIAIAESLR